MKTVRFLSLFAAVAAAGGSFALEDREVDVLVVGGTTRGIEAAKAARAAGKGVYLVTPYAYLGEDLAGTLELGCGTAPKTPLQKRLWRSVSRFAPFEYYADHRTQGARWSFKNDEHNRLSEPNDPSMMDHGVLYLDPVTYRCVLKRPARVTAAEVLVLEAAGARRDDILYDADKARLATEKPGVTKVATGKVTLTFLAGRRKGETVELVRRGKAFDVAMGDCYPAGTAVLYSCPVDSEVSEVSLRIEPDVAAQHQLVSRLRFTLADANSQEVPPTPLKVKQVLDRELLEAGADFLTSTAIRRVFRCGDRLTGVETVSRSGRQVVRAKEVVDATLYGLLGKIPAVGPEETFSRIVISNDTRPDFGDMKVEEIPADIDDARFGFKGKMWRCTFKLPMADGTFPSFAAADWASLDRVRTPWTSDIADVLVWKPSAVALANARPAPDEPPVWGEYDVVVVGGGTAGAAAAVAAARNGAKTLVVECRDVLGGVGTDGMIFGYFDGNKVGFTAEFNEVWEKAKKTCDGKHGRAGVWHGLCAAAGAEVWLGALGLGAVRNGDAVTGVEVSTPFGTGVVRAKCVIDGTGNADVAAAAGAETDFVSAREIAVQSAGQPPQRLGRNGVNSDFGYVNDADARDVWLFMLRARAGSPEAWDISRLPDSRERRRIVPDLRLSGEDVAARRRFPDTLAQALSRQDPHGFLTDDFGYLAEDSAERSPGAQVRWLFRVNVPLRCTLPKGLKGISVVGLGAGIERDVVAITRMQADLMNMGYSVGIAAAMAAAKDGDFRAIDLGELRRRVVGCGILPAEALRWEADEDVSSDAVLAEAVRSLPDAYRGGHVVYRPENRVRALPLLREAYRAASEPRAKQTYALALGLMGDPTGVETLVGCLTGAEELCVVRETPRKFGRAYTGGSVRNGMLLALGRTHDGRALAPLLSELAKLNVGMDSEACRPVLLALEALEAPEAARPLAELLRREGFGGHAVSDIAALTPTGGYGPSPEFDLCLRELAVARALLACGDCEGLARQTCETYAKDCRGLLSAHAKAVLGKSGGNPPPDPARVRQIAAYLPARPGVYCGEEKYDPAVVRRKLEAPPPDCTAATYREAALSGRRKAYQPAFFELASRMVLLAAAAKDSPACVAGTQACLRQACGLKTWLLPPYGSDPDTVCRETRIDLGSSAMAHAVASALCLLGDKADPEVRRLALDTLEKRIFSLYERTNAQSGRAGDRLGNFWFFGRNNWSAVCHAGVVRAALAVIGDPERRARYVEASERAMRIFLGGFLEDGYCTEGSSYWDYGYGHYLDLTTAVIGATGGLVDFSRLPRARRAFLYGAESRLDKEHCPAFSDGGGRVGVKTLKKGVRFFPDLVPSVEGKLPPRTFFPDAQVYIGREPDFAFAVKGGNNGEFHNHNDVGSWMLLVKGVDIAGEGGPELYGRDTFTENRYKSQMLNSYGHPVPVVGGELQPTGARWGAKVLSTSFGDDADRLVLDLSGAYSGLAVDKLGSLVRTIDFRRGKQPSVAISDAAVFSRPLTFESAILTCGDIERLPDGKSVRLTRANAAVTARVDVSGGDAWHFEEKAVPNNGNLPVKRLAVVFDAPVSRVAVTWSLVM